MGTISSSPAVPGKALARLISLRTALCWPLRAAGCSEGDEARARFCAATRVARAVDDELTALKWFTITGRGEGALIDLAQLGDRSIQEGDRVLIDGAEYLIWYIDPAPRMLDIEPGMTPAVLMIRKPWEDLRSAYRPKPALRSASAIEPVGRLSSRRPEFLPRFWFRRS